MRPLTALAAFAFAGLGAAFSTPTAADYQPPPVVTAPGPVVISGLQSEFQKEQSLSPSELMDRWAPLIEEASQRFGISKSWIRAVMQKESAGRTMLDENQPITSDAGAMGIMQVMPDTYNDMRAAYGLGADPYDPHDNVLAGVAYLRWLYGKYGYPQLFAAYNAGPGTLEAQLAGLRQLPAETRDYVSGIGRILGAKPEVARPKLAPLMLTRPDGSQISVDAAAVESVRASIPHEYAPSVQTVVAIGHLKQGVREDLATVTALLRRHGGKV